jgi:hypothetical protein
MTLGLGRISDLDEGLRQITGPQPSRGLVLRIRKQFCHFSGLWPGIIAWLCVSVFALSHSSIDGVWTWECERTWESGRDSDVTLMKRSEVTRSSGLRWRSGREATALQKPRPGHES